MSWSCETSAIWLLGVINPFFRVGDPRSAEISAERKAEAKHANTSSGFASAMLSHLPRLRRYAIALVGDVARADDLIQDCIERALRAQDRLQQIERLYGWLRSILHNLYLDDLRRRQRSPTVNWEDLADSLALSVSPIDRDRAVDFARAMAQLSVDHRQILLLVGLEGMSYREVSMELNVPIGTVMSRLARARDQLRQRLDDFEIGSGHADRGPSFRREPKQ